MSTDTALVTLVRSASRTMVRELGFMRTTLAATDYSASAVHTLLELDMQGALTAAQLVQLLGLEKSSVSRMLAKLMAAGEVAECPPPAGMAADARTKPLQLTAQGRRTAAAIHRYGQQRVQAALQQLSPVLQQTVAQGLSAYAGALHTGRQTDVQQAPQAITIHAGYQPGLIGRVTEMHARFYARHAGFGAFFESKVASGLAEFMGRLDQPSNQIWCAMLQDRIVGAIAIDGQDLGQRQAHLRWFILDDGCRGSGMGRQLLQQALAFCDQQDFAATQLWTFQGLDAARALYEAHDFALVHEASGSQWGHTVTEQQFMRPGPQPIKNVSKA
ncbi:MAG: bifunctional helix-turn-helix transcriptional regulator/GNAT family N-acetyltransferase [Comamonas sp.]